MDREPVSIMRDPVRITLRETLEIMRQRPGATEAIVQPIDLAAFIATKREQDRCYRRRHEQGVSQRRSRGDGNYDGSIFQAWQQLK